MLQDLKPTKEFYFSWNVVLQNRYTCYSQPRITQKENYPEKTQSALQVYVLVWILIFVLL